MYIGIHRHGFLKEMGVWNCPLTDLVRLCALTEMPVLLACLEVEEYVYTSTKDTVKTLSENQRKTV